MPLDAREPKRYRFGRFTLDLARGSLKDGAGDIPLRPKSFDVLRVLVENHGRLVEKDRLHDEVWSRAPVTDDSLTQCLVDIRKAIGDTDRSMIRTIPRRGYVFDAPIEIPDRDPLPRLVERTLTVRRIALASAAIVLIAAGAYLLPFSNDNSNLTANTGSPSIAVLPFENRSTGTGSAYLAEGIQDEVLMNLAKFEDLSVISRTSVATLRNHKLSVPEIGELLGASSIIEGSVQLSGNNLRVNVNLIDVASDRSIWAKQYDRHLSAEDLFAVQNEIASTIAVELGASLTPDLRRQVSKVRTANLDAYESYHKGVELLVRRTGDSLKGAAAYFREAIRLDPTFALAYVGLADAYMLLVTHSELGEDDVLPPALDAANAALELDPDLGEAYASLGAIHHEAQQRGVDLGVAAIPVRLFERAIELSPNYAPAHQWYGEYLLANGQFDKAIGAYQVAVELDPLSPIIHHVYGGALLKANRFEEAERRYLRAIEIDPGFSRAYQGLAGLYLNRWGRLADAAHAARKAVTLNPSDVVSIALLANIYLNMGDTVTATHWIDEGKKLDPRHPYLASIHAAVLVERGEDSVAVKVLETLRSEGVVHQANLRLLKDIYLSDGQYDSALDICESQFPEIRDAASSLSIKRREWSAIECAQVLIATDHDVQAQSIVDHVRQQMDEDMLKWDGWSNALLAAIHAFNGNDESAFNALRRAADTGWRHTANYYLTRSELFSDLHDHAEYGVILSELQDFLAAERRKLEETLIDIPSD